MSCLTYNIARYIGKVEHPSLSLGFGFNVET